MNLCFVANYEKTLLFNKVAQQLINQDGTRIFWLTVNRKIHEFLLENYEPSTVVLIDKNTILDTPETHDTSDNYKLNELWYGDRVLKNESWGDEYLSKLSHHIYKFIASNNIRFIFGEQTWAHELLIHRICSLNQELNCTFLSPHTIRIPEGRFAFFSDEFQATIKEINPDKTGNYEPLRAKKPDYLKLNDKILKSKSKPSYFIKKIKYFFSERIFERHDPTKPDSFLRAFLRFSSFYLYKWQYLFFVKEISIQDLYNKNFVLYTLHKQPEASVDNTGRYYENQLIIIKNIWRILPKDTLLIVKEHSNAIGDRPLRFYNEIKRFKDVKFIHYKEDSYRLIEKAKAIFTISGTIAYEAALLKTPSFTFIPIFFNDLSLCKDINFDTLRDPSLTLEKLIRSVSLNDENDARFSNWIYNNSFSGIISDYKSNPACMSDENIQKIKDAIARVVTLI